MINIWYDNKVNGRAYNAPADKPVFFLMKDGGSAVAPLYGFEESLPANVLAKFNSVKKQIIDGSLKVELKLKSLKSD